MGNFGPGRKRGFTKTLVSLPPEQLEALRKEAAQRTLKRGEGRMDTGEIIREAVALRGEKIELGYLVVERALKLISALIDKQKHEDAADLLDQVEKLAASTAALLGEPTPDAERLMAGIAKAKDMLQTKLAEHGTKGKRGRK